MKTYSTKRLIGAAMILAMLFTMTIFGAFNVSAADPQENTGEYKVDFKQATGEGSEPATITAIENVLFGTAITDVTFTITLDKNDDHISKTGFSPAASAPSLKVTSSDSKVVSAKFTDSTKTAIHLVALREGTATITLTVGKQTFTKAAAGDDPKVTYTYDATEFTFDVTVVEATMTVNITSDPIVTFETTGVANGGAGTSQYLAIDFANDKAIASAAIVAYSADGGTKWNALKDPIKKDATLNGSLTGASLATAVGKGTDITKLLDKGGNLMFTTKLDGKKAAAGATIWVVGEVAKRPKTPKLTAYYGIVDADDKLTKPNNWTIAVNGSVPEGGEDDPVILFATAFGDGKNPDKDSPSTKTVTIGGETYATTWLSTFGFKPFSFTDGYPVAKLAKATDKPASFVFLARLAPVIEVEGEGTADVAYSFTAGSKPAKLKVVGEQKPISAKVDYKKETVSLKPGSAYYFIGAKDEEGGNATPSLGITMTGKTGIPFSGDGEIAGIIDRTNAGESATLTVWTEANGKKPRSMKSDIKVWGYGTVAGIKAADLTAGIKGAGTEKAAFKLPKGYQVRDIGGETWGTTISVSATADRVGEDTSNAWEVRKLGTAKYDAKNTNWISDTKGTTTVAAKLSFEYKSFKLPTEKGEPAEYAFYLNKAKVGVLSGSDTTATANVTFAVTTGGSGSFDGTTKTITVNVANAISSVVLTATKATTQTLGTADNDVTLEAGKDAAAAQTITVNTSDIASTGGSKTFTITVSEDGKTAITYTITVTVAAPAGQEPTADVAFAVTTGGSGSFDGTTKTITVNVANAISSVVLTATKATTQTLAKGGTNGTAVALEADKDEAAAQTITVNTNDIASIGGSKIFTITVSEDGKTAITYTITVTVAAPAVKDPTANVTFALTDPEDDGTNTITGGGTDETVSVIVEKGTEKVILTAAKGTAQTLAKGGTDGTAVELEADKDEAAAQTITVDTKSGSKTFTITVSEEGKADITYTITVTVAEE